MRRRVPLVAMLLVAAVTQALAQTGDLTELMSGSDLFTNSVLGVAVVALVYYIMLQRAELRDLRAAHKVELAEKDKLVMQLQESRLTEVRIGTELAQKVVSTLDTMLALSRVEK